MTYHSSCRTQTPRTAWVPLAQDTIVQKIECGAHSTDVVEIPIEFSYNELGPAVRALLDRGTFGYRVSGRIDVSRPISRACRTGRPGASRCRGPADRAAPAVGRGQPPARCRTRALVPAAGARLSIRDRERDASRPNNRSSARSWWRPPEGAVGGRRPRAPGGADPAHGYRGRRGRGHAPAAPRSSHPKLYIGDGKAEEVRDAGRGARRHVVIFDEDLAPGQLRTWRRRRVQGRGPQRAHPRHLRHARAARSQAQTAGGAGAACSTPTRASSACGRTSRATRAASARAAPAKRRSRRTAAWSTSAWATSGAS